MAPSSLLEVSRSADNAHRLSTMTLATTALVRIATSTAVPLVGRVVLTAATALAQVHAIALPSLRACDDDDVVSDIRVVVFGGLRSIAMSRAAVAASPEVVNVWRGVELVEPTATPAISLLSTVDLARRFNVLRATSGPPSVWPPPPGQDPVSTSANVDSDDGAGVHSEQDPVAVELDTLRRLVLQVGCAVEGMLFYCGCPLLFRRCVARCACASLGTPIVTPRAQVDVRARVAPPPFGLR